jgi:hypothetical protein
MKQTLMKTIQDRFNSEFSRWDIQLPPDDVVKRRRGKIIKAGWAIWYLFASNEKGEYLDYYSSHRMTSSSHIRIYNSGEEEELPTIAEIRLCSEDPEEDGKLEAKYCAENQRVEKLLQEKGFGLTGDEPFAIQFNRALLTNSAE